MSFSATGARRPLQSKPKQNPFLKRASSSSFDQHARTKPDSSAPVAKRARTAPEAGDDEPLQQARIVVSLPRAGSQDVKSLMRHARDGMFSELPERAAGMNSVTISKTLNYQRDTAPIVSLAHLHALSKSPTSTDRQIAEMMQRGELRKISVPGRGRGGAPIGDGVILTSDWTALVRGSGLGMQLQDKYLMLLKTHPSTATVGATECNVDEASELIAAGFFTSTSALSTSVADSPSRSTAFSLGVRTPVSEAGTTAPTGSHDAVGGKGAVHLRGGGVGGLPSGDANKKRATGSLTFSIPGVGAYLKLLSEAQHHLVQLLVKSSPRHQEALKDMLRERWDGNVLGGDEMSRAKRARGEWTGVLAGQTKKWKSFYGLNFDWVLEECLGGGLVECFDTGSVGLGVRVVR